MSDARPEPRGQEQHPVGDIRDLCIGLFGIQVVWGLQTASTSRIFQSLGADLAELPLLWIAGPVTGLLIQPLVGSWSDRLGVRAPFIAVGSLLTAVAMIGMAGTTSLTCAVAMLWLLTASLNVAMQPFRTIAADRLAPSARPTGFAIQAAFIGAGAVFASLLPWLLADGVPSMPLGPDQAAPGPAANVRQAYVIGAIVLLVSVAWTLKRAIGARRPGRRFKTSAIAPMSIGAATGRVGLALTCGGILVMSAASGRALPRELLLLGTVSTGAGLAMLIVKLGARRGLGQIGLLAPFAELGRVPRALRRLALTQFLTWFALFATWVYLVPAVAARQFGSRGPASAGYAAAADWVGVLFAIQDGVAVAAALALPALVRRTGPRAAHGLCLAAGAAGLAGFAFCEADLLWLPAIGLGIAWASVLSAPYAMVAAFAPTGRIGTYMGLHNVALVVPQLVGAGVLGTILVGAFEGDPSAIPLLASGALGLASATCMLLPLEWTVQEVA